MSHTITHALWLPLRSSLSDSLGNASPVFIGTDTNAFATPGYLTFTAGAGLCVAVTGEYVEAMWDLSTLVDGAIAWSVEIWHDAIPTSSRDYLLSLSNYVSDNTYGALAFGIGLTDNFLLQYAKRAGATNQSHPFDLIDPMDSSARGAWVQIGCVIHRNPSRNAGRLVFCGFSRGKVGRGTHLLALEGSEPTVSPTAGLRLFGLANGEGTGSSTWGNEAGMNARARNFVAWRVEGDALARVPKWMHDLRRFRDEPRVIKDYRNAA